MAAAVACGLHKFGVRDYVVESGENMILLFLNIAVIIAVLSTLGGAEDFGGAFQAALFVLLALGFLISL